MAILKRFAAILAVVALVGCATTEGDMASVDPYEPTNRDIHDFNKGVDRHLLRPVAQAYDAVTPELFKFLIGNFLNYLELPRDFANHLLQGDLEAAGYTFARFGVNTVGGIGVLDPASDVGLPKDDADFGQTLGVWGADTGPYFELPLLGPSTARHSVGRVVDIIFAPTTYIGGTAVSVGVTAVAVTDARERNLELIDNVLYESADSYATSRSAYLQMRKSFVNGGGADREGAPDLELIE